MYKGVGRYRHYKGGEYDVIGLAVAEWTKDRSDEALANVATLVIYTPTAEFIDKSLLPGAGGQVFWARPLDAWSAGFTNKPGDYFDAMVGNVPRFEKMVV